MNKIHYKGWKQSLTDFQKDLKKELAAVRKAKQELYEMQRQLQEMVYSGRYERDEDTLILSAPNIIIGNVDKHGNLLTGGSHVVIRSNDIALEGVGQSDGVTVTGGSVVTRARTVKVQTVDPGPDGLESVAFSDSSFTVQSAAVGMVAEKLDENVKNDMDNGGVFTLKPKTDDGSISLAAEMNINVLAACAISSDAMSSATSTLETQAGNYEAAANTAISEVETETTQLDKIQNDSLLNLLGAAGKDAEKMSLRTGLYKFDERSDASVAASLKMAKSIIDFTSNMSNYAEATRIKEYLTKRSGRISTAADSYATTPSLSKININSEVINLSTTGTDGKLRTTPNNGVNINTQHTCIMAIEGTIPVENSTFILKNDNVNIDTSKYEYATVENKITPTKCTAAGNLTINSHSIDIQTMDKEFEGSVEDLKTKTSTINADSIVNINTNHVNLDMTGSDGKALGKFCVNAKDISFMSCDVDDKGKVTNVANEGHISLDAKNINMGSSADPTICDIVEISSKKTNIFGNEQVTIKKTNSSQQLIIKDKVELAADEINLVGKTNLKGETKIDSEFIATVINVKTVNASESVSGPNIKDGTSLSKAAPNAKPSKTEEPQNREPVQSKINSIDNSCDTILKIK